MAFVCYLFTVFGKAQDTHIFRRSLLTRSYKANKLTNFYHHLFMNELYLMAKIVLCLIKFVFIHIVRFCTIVHDLEFIPSLLSPFPQSIIRTRSTKIMYCGIFFLCIALALPFNVKPVCGAHTVYQENAFGIGSGIEHFVSNVGWLIPWLF